MRPLVDSAFQGAKVTCFAYGQTGSGKTYTMNGNLAQGNPGLYTLGANEIFQYLASVNIKLISLNLDILRPNYHSIRSTVGVYTICSTNGISSNSDKIIKIT